MKKLWLVLSALSLAVIGAACVHSFSSTVRTDFAMFWNADKIAYPPPYLFFVKPFGALPYGWAFLAWLVATGALYFAATPSPKSAAFANPAAAYNGLIGQNGFLTSGILFAGLRDLAAHPARAGAILGLLIVKPQLALALPIVVVSGGYWRAIPGALATTVTMIAAALLVFGPQAYIRFFEEAGFYTHLLDTGGWGWAEVASVFGFARWCGASLATAWAFQIAAALAAAAAVWHAWRRDIEGKIALASAATLLISPYLFTYDATLLTFALAVLTGWRAVVLWLLAALPLVRVFVHWDWPNTVPAAAAFAVATILLESVQERRKTQEPAPAGSAS